MNSEMDFRRNEKKYLLNQESIASFFELVSDLLVPGEYAHSTVHSLYFDTPTGLLARRSEAAPLYKEKLRLRSYGKDFRQSPVYFLELKKKYEGIVYKRRVLIDAQEALAVASGTAPLHAHDQISRELNWAIDRYAKLHPGLLISCERDYYRLREQPEIRLTIDSNLRFFNGPDFIHGQDLLPAQEYLMELKTPGAIPYRLSLCLSQARVYPSSFSKYTRACTQLERSFAYAV